MPQRPGLHLAIIMDGNGRWAVERGLPRPRGHEAGAESLRRVIEAAPDLGVSVLTLFAFSSDNWKRPRAEVDALMALFESYLGSESARCAAEGIRLRVIGRRDRLPRRLRKVMRDAERRTAGESDLELRFAVDYSSRDAILAAALRWRDGFRKSREEFARLLTGRGSGTEERPDVDLLIRTGGEKRLSDFLLWECAYAELWFTDTMWPDFGAAELTSAVTEFRRRERRFGSVPRPRLTRPSRAAGAGSA